MQQQQKHDDILLPKDMCIYRENVIQKTQMNISIH